jgi:RimJ/RimL family protein N-acetyltransferase
MIRPFLIANRIYLRPLEPEDLGDPYLEWINDPEVTEFLVTGSFPMTARSLEQYYDSVQPPTDIMLGIVQKEDDLHVGNIRLGPINYVNHSAYIGIMVGDKTMWNRGYGTEAIDLMLGHAFHSLNLHRVVAGVFAEHAAMISVYERFGFVVEGQYRDSWFLHGKYHDEAVLGLLEDDYQPASEHKRSSDGD